MGSRVVRIRIDPLNFQTGWRKRRLNQALINVWSSSGYSELSCPGCGYKAPELCHVTPILKSLHWLKVNERIEYKLLSLTYKALTTAQPTYLHSLISFQPPRATRSSSVVTLSRPPTSSLRITNRSFRYACLISGINFLSHSVSLAQNTLLMMSHSLIHLAPTYSPLSPSITHSLFHSRLKTHIFHKSFPP